MSTNIGANTNRRTISPTNIPSKMRFLSFLTRVVCVEAELTVLFENCDQSTSSSDNGCDIEASSRSLSGSTFLYELVFNIV